MSETDSTDAPVAEPKQDPESFVLRGNPRPVIRFRRGLIIGVAGALGAMLIGVAWIALDPPSFRLASGDGQALSRGRVAEDGLANAPASYADVPRLGPPLPGDLGRGILEHERSLSGAASPDAEASAARSGEQSQREAERQRLASEAEAARASPVLIRLTAAAPDGIAPSALSASPALAAPPPTIVAPAPSGGQLRKVDFTAAAPGDSNSRALIEAPSPWTLSAGTIIPASLITGLNSDLPGLVIAQVTENVSDTATGRTVLIPQGARLIGSYDSMVAYGQRRALLVWQRIVFPDGSSVALDKMPATDTAGFAGLEDRVDSHSWQLIKGIALSTVLGVGTQIGLGGNESDLVRAVRESTQQNAAHAGEHITTRNLDVQPTLTVRPGWPVRAMVSKDLVLKPWRG